MIPSPDAAYEQCYDYLPECTQPFPYEDLDNNPEENGNGYYNGNGIDAEEDNDKFDGSTDGSIDENSNEADEIIPVTEPLVVTPTIFTIFNFDPINQTESTAPVDNEVIGIKSFFHQFI